LSSLRDEQVRKEIETTGFEVAPAAWAAEADGTDNSIALTEQPRVRETKAVDDADGADMVA
jgi:hypothetical protein